MTSRLRALFCDSLSMVRGKYLPIGREDTRFCRSTFGVHYDRDLLDAPGALTMQGLPDMELRWRSTDVRQCWEPLTKVVLGDLFDDEGRPLPECPRGALKRAISNWEGKKLTPKVGVELEAYAFIRDTDGSLKPYDNPGGIVYGTGVITDPMRLNDQIWEAAVKAGFSLDMITAEFDIPQFEYTLTFDDALKAVDDVILFRLMAREIAYENGVILTFLPKPLSDTGGSGMHINFSLWDKRKKNVLSSGAKGGVDQMNSLARGCVAGLVTHHKALAGLLAPNVNSYDRLEPGSLSGYWQNWGGDHRNVTSRVSSEGGNKARIEHRMADASSNPYTAVASVLQAAFLGVEGKYKLQAAETGNGFDKTDAKEGVADSLDGSLKDLRNDKELTNAVGTALVENHLYMKFAEIEKTKSFSWEELRDFYIPFV